jgi:TctA family transporter
MMLGFVLGPMVEENLRRTLQVSRGDPSVFVTRPLSLAFIVATVLILIVMAPGRAVLGEARRLITSREHQNQRRAFCLG